MVDGSFGHPPSTIGHQRGFMQFEVNGQTYFLNFEAGEGKWFVYEPTRDGMLAMAVHSDDAPLLTSSAMVVRPEDVKEVN